MVCDGDRRHVEVLGGLHERFNLVRAVKQTVLSMNMEVDELRRHVVFLSRLGVSDERRLILGATRGEVN